MICRWGAKTCKTTPLWSFKAYRFWYVCADNRLFVSLGGLTLGLWIHGSRTWEASAPGKKCFWGNIQFVRVEERSKVHLWGGDDGTVYHHLTATCGSKKWRERRARGREEWKQQNGANHKWEVEREQRNIWTESNTEKKRGGGGKKGGKKVGKTNWKNRGERFSIPPLPALRLSLAVLIHGSLGL